MSRIGKKQIKLPKEVTVEIKPGELLVKGQKGQIKQEIPFGISIEQKEDTLFVQPELSSALPSKKGKNIPALWGLTTALLLNNVKGVSEGFEKKLEIRGVGFKAALEGTTKLRLDLGFSHPIIMEIPLGLSVAVEKQFIIISGFDKQQVGQFAAKVRAHRKPEPYKGKGVRYFGEIVRKKEGKKAGK
ncbi:MAG: 50S ribosomal protein L6 [Candidatus Pacebacteria bacterium]|nr:50S ribosomal protein L6 [Candidatus Paceibacterota bacterium]